MASDATTPPPAAAAAVKMPKLHGRAFYESLGSPKYIVAPMVDQSEFVSRVSPARLASSLSCG
jgi:tRNA-dihydrouridine synthase 1